MRADDEDSILAFGPDDWNYGDSVTVITDKA